MKTILTIIGIVLFLLLTGFAIRKYQEMDTSTPKSTTLPNPASQNCIEKGGSLRIMERGDGGQYGLCEFEDNMSCEEWALFRGDCPVGGVKTTGFDNIEQKYCAWVGGQTLAEKNSNCILPDGTTCSDKALYNGNCVPHQVNDPDPNTPN